MATVVQRVLTVQAGTLETAKPALILTIARVTRVVVQRANAWIVAQTPTRVDAPLVTSNRRTPMLPVTRVILPVSWYQLATQKKMIALVQPLATI